MAAKETTKTDPHAPDNFRRDVAGLISRYGKLTETELRKIFEQELNKRRK